MMYLKGILPPTRVEHPHAARCARYVVLVADLFEEMYLSDTVDKDLMVWILASLIIKQDPAERESAKDLLKWAKINLDYLKANAHLPSAIMSNNQYFQTLCENIPSHQAQQEAKASQQPAEFINGKSQVHRPMQYLRRADGRIELTPQPAKAQQPAPNKSGSEEAVTEIPNNRKNLRPHTPEGAPNEEKSAGPSKRQKV